MSEHQLPEGYKQTEFGVIPEDWEVRSCSELSERIVVGIVIRPTQYYVPLGVRAFRSANIREKGISDSDLVFISETSNALLAKSQTRIGDILTVRTGYPGTSAVVRSKHAGCNCIDILITRPSKQVDSDYLAIWINSSFGKDQVLRNQGGLAQKHFNVGDMRNLVVALPSLLEQCAIAQALSDVDALITSLDKLIAKKRHLKTATMQQLLTGKKRLPGFGEGKGYKQTEVGVIPEDWDVQYLKSTLKNNPQYGINAAAVPYRDSLPIYIRITDISEAGYFSPETLVSVNKENSDQYYLENGDLVFARTGASVGKSYLYDPNDGELVFAGFLIRIRPDENILLPIYLSQYVKTKTYWNWVQLMSMRSGQPGINGNEYGQMLVPFPEIKEQRAIAAVLSDMDTDIAALEARRDKTQAIKQGMMQELLTGKTRLV